MRTLAIDIGGTKLAVGLFTGDDGGHHKLVARELRMTDRSRGPGWMLRAISEIVEPWAQAERRPRHPSPARHKGKKTFILIGYRIVTRGASSLVDRER